MLGSTMLSSLFKGEERAVASLRNAQEQTIGYAESMYLGEVRGFMHEELVAEEQAEGRAGAMEVAKILYGQAKPYVSAVPRSNEGNMQDWQTFFNQSEQIESHLLMNTAVRDTTDGPEVNFCGGVLVQRMPQASKEGDDDSALKKSIQVDDAPTWHSVDWSNLMKTEGMIETMNALLPELELEEKEAKMIPMDFFCRCNKQSYVDRIASYQRMKFRN